jgi:phage/plasmid-like protein (TIGR03299 family)
MAHELSIRENGFVEFCYTGDRNLIWHGLGNQLSDDPTMDEVTEKSGMSFSIQRAPVTYIAENGAYYTDDSKHVIHRSDTHSPLGIVSDKFHVVQPTEVLNFFDELIEKHGMKMSSAGVLFGGKRFFALAETGKATKIAGKDDIEGYLLLSTSADGTMATTATFTSVRVVCNNTLTVALNGAKSCYRQTHKSQFDAKSAYIDLGLIDKSWDNFIGNINTLLETPMTDTQVKDYYRSLYVNDDNEISKTNEANADKMFGLYNSGAGANIIKGNAWGALNGVTNLYTHGNGRKRDVNGTIWSSYTGDWAKMKTKAMDKLLDAA